MSGWNRLLIMLSSVTAFVCLVAGWALAPEGSSKAAYASGAALGGIMLLAVPAWGFCRGLFWVVQGFRPK